MTVPYQFLGCSYPRYSQMGLNLCITILKVNFNSLFFLSPKIMFWLKLRESFKAKFHFSQPTGHIGTGFILQAKTNSTVFALNAFLPLINMVWQQLC